MATDPDTTAVTGRAPTTTSGRIGLAVAVASGTGLVLTAAVMGRSLWFFSDDWNIYADYHSGNLRDPFNGHLSLVPAGLYQLLFHTAGMESYWPYRLCGLGALAVLAFQVARFTHHRVGPWAAALAVTAVMWNSAGSTNVLFPFLMNFSLPIAALLAVWWHLDRRSTGHDLAASAWLALALATSGLGVMVLAAVVVELAVSRAPWRRWAALSPGVILWGAWYITHRDSSSASTDIGAVVSYCARMFLGGTTSLAAGWKPGGVVLAVAFVGVVALAALRWRSLDARSLGALAAPAAFIGLTAVTRLAIVPRIPPDELRYRWAVAAYLVFAVVVMWRPATERPDRAPPPELLGTVPRRALIAVSFVVLALGAVQLVRGMQSWTDQVTGAAPGLRSNLFAVEAVGPRRIDPHKVLPLSYVPVTAGGYLSAVADVGSPIAGEDPAGFGGHADQVRSADTLLVGQLPITAVTADAVPAGCDRPVDLNAVAPGTVLVFGRGTPVSQPLRIARFLPGATDGVEVPVAPDAAAVVVPADAPSERRTGASRPYRVDPGAAGVSGACPAP